jgi:hypothetical protein
MSEIACAVLVAVVAVVVIGGIVTMVLPLIR